MAKKSTAVAELSAFLDFEVHKGMKPEVLAEQIARKANDIAPEDWEELSDDTQRWVNNAIQAIEDKEAVPLPTGLEDILQEADALEKEETVVEETNEIEGSGDNEEHVDQVKKSVKKTSAKRVRKSNGGERRGPKAGFPGTAVIHILAKENPKRVGSLAAKRFKLYKNGQTVAEAIAAGLGHLDLRYDSRAKHIEVRAK